MLVVLPLAISPTPFPYRCLCNFNIRSCVRCTVLVWRILAQCSVPSLLHSKVTTFSIFGNIECNALSWSKNFWRYHLVSLLFAHRHDTLPEKVLTPLPSAELKRKICSSELVSVGQKARNAKAASSPLWHFVRQKLKFLQKVSDTSQYYHSPTAYEILRNGHIMMCVLCTIVIGLKDTLWIEIFCYLWKSIRDIFIINSQDEMFKKYKQSS